MSPEYKKHPKSSVRLGEDELIGAGLSDLHARHLLDLLGDDGLTLEDMASWSQEQQKSRLQEAFPLMSVGKINQVLKKLRLSIYDNKNNGAALCERPPSSQVAAERMRSGRRPLESRDDNVALSAISTAMEEIANASKTWIDIADAADGLLMYEREEDAKNWATHQAFLRENTRVAQLNDTAEEEEDLPQSPIFQIGPSKLVPQSASFSASPVGSPTSGQMVPQPPARKLNEPAPWKRKDKLYQLLNEQQKEQDPMSLDSPTSEDLSPRKAKDRIKRGRNRALKDMEQATRVKPDYNRLIEEQKHELEFVDNLHRKYQAMVTKLLEEQAGIDMDMDNNPWDLALGMVFDNKERHLKRRLLHLVGAAPEADEDAINCKHKRLEDQMIEKELDNLVNQIDVDGDGLLTNEELAARLQDNPMLLLRLQALRINIALSSENTLQGEFSKTRRAMMQLQLRSVHDKMDLDKNGYIDVDELIEVGTNNPDLTRKLETLGVHLKAMLRTARNGGADLPPLSPVKGSPRKALPGPQTP